MSDCNPELMPEEIKNESTLVETPEHMGSAQDSVPVTACIVPTIAPNVSVRVVLKSVADVVARQKRWLWPGKIPLDGLTAMIGAPGLGKSFMTIDLTMRVTLGRCWPDGTPCPLGSVLMIACEDNMETDIKPRLVFAGADVNRVKFIEHCFTSKGSGPEREVSFDIAQIHVLLSAIEMMPDCRLVIIDPIGSCMAPGTDTYRDNEVRAQLKPLIDIAEQRDVAILYVMHNKKGGTPYSIDECGLGARAFTATARSVLHVVKNPDDDNGRILLAGKINAAGSRNGWNFTIDGEMDPVNGLPLTPGLLTWGEPYYKSGDEFAAMVNARRHGKAGERGPAPAARDAVAEWLESVLANGPVRASVVDDLAKANNISATTLTRARKAISARTEKEKKQRGCNYWMLQRHTLDDIASANPPATAVELPPTVSQ